METVSHWPFRLSLAPLASAGRSWLAWRRERRELLSMDDRSLRDIDLTRTDAVMEARKPFWRMER